MIETSTRIELTIDLEQPAELNVLLGMFSAIGNQFQQYLRDQHPNLVDDNAKIYVSEIRSGSIIADLLPFIPLLIENLDRAVVVDEFVRRYGGMILRLGEGKEIPNLRRSDLEDLMNGVTAIANDPGGKSTIKSVQYDKDGSKTRVSIEFDNVQATRAIKTIESQAKNLEHRQFEVVENELLVFWQSNLKQSTQGKRTGELAIMECVSKKPLAVIYDSDLAEQRIRHELTEGERNIYKLGFYVTARVERLNDRAVAYRISEVHEIIALPDDDAA